MNKQKVIEAGDAAVRALVIFIFVLGFFIALQECATMIVEEIVWLD
jgi:hypothetical protein